MRLEIDAGIYEEAFAPYREKVETVLRSAAAEMALPKDCLCSLMLVDEEEIREINADTREVDAPTDVLSFPMLDYAPGEMGKNIRWENHPQDRDPETGEYLLGDIALCWPIMLRQGEEYGHGPTRECCFLILHGLLHLLGYDHMTPEDEAVMMAAAENILSEENITRAQQAQVPAEPVEFKTGFIAIVGRSNVGKSTLMNALVGEKVSIVSNRAQTTRNIIRGILTDEDSQIVFVDTPGMHRPRTRLGQYMEYAAEQAITGVDGIMVVLDASEPFLAGDKSVLDKVRREGAPIIAVLNKIDKMEKIKLLELMEKLSAYPEITEVVPVSAAKRDGLQDLLRTLKKLLPVGDPMFDADDYTDQPERVLVAELIREKALNALKEEIPHGIGVEVLSMEADEQGGYTIHANILCERDSHKGVIIGRQGAMLRQIGTRARKDIQYMLDAPVYLQLWVKVKENWRDNLSVMRDLGYDRRLLDD